MRAFEHDNSYLASLLPRTTMVHERRETEPFRIGETEVEWHIARLQHKRPQALEPLHLLVRLPAEASVTVEVPFKIYATEFVDPQEGTLHFDIEVRALDWQVAEAEDAQRQSDEKEEEKDED